MFQQIFYMPDFFTRGCFQDLGGTILSSRRGSGFTVEGCYWTARFAGHAFFAIYNAHYCITGNDPPTASLQIVKSGNCPDVPGYPSAFYSEGGQRSSAVYYIIPSKPAFIFVKPSAEQPLFYGCFHRWSQPDLQPLSVVPWNAVDECQRIARTAMFGYFAMVSFNKTGTECFGLDFRDIRETMLTLPVMDCATDSGVLGPPMIPTYYDYESAVFRAPLAFGTHDATQVFKACALGKPGAVFTPAIIGMWSFRQCADVAQAKRHRYYAVQFAKCYTGNGAGFLDQMVRAPSDEACTYSLYYEPLSYTQPQAYSSGDETHFAVYEVN